MVLVLPVWHMRNMVLAGAKALVIMAKNYLALKDNYQASYTVDQIIANYQDFPEIVAEAKEVKSQIKK